MSIKYNVAIMGATGAVGNCMLKFLNNWDIKTHWDLRRRMGDNVSMVKNNILNEWMKISTDFSDGVHVELYGKNAKSKEVKN